MNRIFLFGVCVPLMSIFAATAQSADNTPPEGFTALFNGKDLSGWKGLLKEPYDNPIKPGETLAGRIEKIAGRGRRTDAKDLEGGRRRFGL